MSTSRKKPRQKQAVQGFRDGKEGKRDTGCVDMLAFKYMEMCKVESSTDCESDISPRWSDTSTKGCMSSTPESRTTRKMLTFVPKPGRSHLPSLDPYDGSSEDSGSLERGPRGPRHGGRRMRSKGRRVAPQNPGAPFSELGGCESQAGQVVAPPAPADVQMRSSSDSDRRAAEMAGLSSPRGHKEMAADSGMHTESSLCTPGLFADAGATPARRPESPSHHRRQAGPHWLRSKSPGSPAALKCLPKRKSCLFGAEAGESGLRKRQCLLDMEVGPFAL